MPLPSPDRIQETAVLGVAFASAAILLAGSATATIRFDLNQVGGTAIAGHGSVGDNLVLSIDVTIEDGDVAKDYFAALEWDLEGGDILDVARATESAYQLVDSAVITPINDVYVMFGSVTGMSMNFDGGDSFPVRDSEDPALLAGPTVLLSWELVNITTPHSGPASFSLGTAEFVINELGTTTISFRNNESDLTHLAGFRSFIFGPRDYPNHDLSDLVEYGTFDVISNPEPSTALLLSFGLAATALARRRLRL